MDDGMEGQTSLGDETKIVQEFCDLLEISKQLFNGLRDLPQYGQRQWQPYFAKTFETYTKLWKFQQENRLVLDRNYDLKRWQIGEIASKIGQLYYHYYLRTSETNYLNEAYQFYSAIRTRNYYRNAHKEDNADLLLKKHRYYARFIVVCLLLNYKKDVYSLVKDFSRQVDDNKTMLHDNEDDEWDYVVREIKEFTDSDPVQVLRADTYKRCDLTMRLVPSKLPPLDKSIQPIVTLGDAILVGNSPSQLKFSELTIDMYRMVQVLERAPFGSLKSQFMQRMNPSQETSDRLIKRENPHKYLLYRPTFFQLLAYLSTAVKELPTGNALLLYLSARGSAQKLSRKMSTETLLEEGGYDVGGVITNNKNDEKVRKHTTLKNEHCIHPADLYPFTRKPMLIIIDSDNAKAFDNIPNLFGQPIICLMAPDELPNSIKDTTQGRLMTTFLYSPILAFMMICGIDQTSDKVYESCSKFVDKVLYETQKIFTKSQLIDFSFLQFFGDDFLRLILLRFVFFHCTLRLHRAYKDTRFYPKSHPVLPDEDLLGSTVIRKAVIDMADMLGVRGLFHDRSL